MEPSNTKPVRVVLLHNFLSPTRVPLFEALARRFDLDVWILGDVRAVRDWPADAPGAACRIRTLPHVAVPLGSRYNVVLANYSLPRELARLRPQAIVCCGWDTPAAFFAARYATRTNTPFVLWSGSTAAESTYLRQFTKPLVRGLVRKAHAWVAYGSRAKDYLVSLGADADRTFLAYNTVELDAFAADCANADRDALRAKLGINTKHVALYCGNLLDLKGVGDLIESFAHVCGKDTTSHLATSASPLGVPRSRGLDGTVSGNDLDLQSKAAQTGGAKSTRTSTSTTNDGANDISLVLVGSGKHEAKYRARAGELGIADRVVFAGFVPRDAMPAYYAIGDVLVLPSRSEVWGLVINEALACGLPVIVSDACGAAPDLVHNDENGFVVPPRDPAALARALANFFAHPERHEAMRAAARAAAAPFTIERAADAFADAVRCALERR